MQPRLRAQGVLFSGWVSGDLLGQVPRHVRSGQRTAGAQIVEDPDVTKRVVLCLETNQFCWSSRLSDLKVVDCQRAGRVDQGDRGGRVGLGGQLSRMDTSSSV